MPAERFVDRVCMVYSKFQAFVGEFFSLVPRNSPLASLEEESVDSRKICGFSVASSLDYFDCKGVWVGEDDFVASGHLYDPAEAEAT